MGAGTRLARAPRGQATIEWVGLVCVVALALAALVWVGARVPGADLARALGEKLLCATAMVDRCGDEPLTLAYGDEVAGLVRQHAPALHFERGSKALPVDFRQCRRPACGDGTPRGIVDRTDTGLPVTAFVRVIDCREAPGSTATAAPSPRAPECAGPRAGHLYLQYWFYYADSATLRGVPIAAERGYHRDDWESAQFRIGPDGAVDQRVSSHHGYNHARGVANWASDAGIGPLRAAAERLGARPVNGWGPASGALHVSGGSHAGAVGGTHASDRRTPGDRVRLVPLEPLAAGIAPGAYRFAVKPPWRKRAWLDPEATGTD